MSFRKTSSLSLTILLFLTLASRTHAVRPLSANVAMVAGGDTRPGFQDGSFTSARFNKPLGMAIDEAGNNLYVIDTGNNRIRVIHLDHDNEVTTLAGQATPGNLDGPLANAQFHEPRGILYLPGGRLVVNDLGNNLFRLVDLKAGTVATLAGARTNATTLAAGPATQLEMKEVRDMAYLPAADSIFYTQPEQGALKRLDLRTGLVSVEFGGNAKIPKPSALGVWGNKLCVADHDLPEVFTMEWKGNSLSSPVSLVPTQTRVLSLALNGGILYALLDTPGIPMQRFFLPGLPKDFTEGFNAQFNGKPVSFRSPWGDSIPPERLFPDKDGDDATPIGFVADPLDIRKFYVSRANLDMIVSFRDLFGFEWNPQAGDHNSNGLDAPEYPAKKPRNTFRMILVGDSRSAEVQNFQFQSDYHFQPRPKEYPSFPQNLSLAPQIERELDLQAALDAAPMNFEVLNFSRHGEFQIWPTYAVPEIVKRNDIDLVIIFMSDPTPYDIYFDHRMGPEGIPLFPADPEYQLKPALQRIPDGAPRRFYDFCAANKLVNIANNTFHFEASVLDRPEIRDTIVELFGKPLGLLNEKLSAMRTSDGKPVRLVLCNTYTGRCWEKNPGMPIWREAAKKFGFGILDLNDEMNALNLSYFPLTGDSTHLNPDGCAFFGRLLAHDLIRDRWVPWKAPSDH